MPSNIEDYALIGDCHSAALVGRDGSIDWLCLPRFDSGACFAALLGNADNGRWQIAPAQAPTGVSRRYRHDTLILETDFECAQGRVRVIDFMALDQPRRHLVRIVEGLAGVVTMHSELVIRFDYGSIVPWVHQAANGLMATAGPDTLSLHTPIALRGEDLKTRARFDVQAGQCVPFVLAYRPSHQTDDIAVDARQLLDATQQAWRDWSGRCRYDGRWRDAVTRSLITLKALTYAPTGGIVAAATTSLPEQAGGVRNWDYRYCWLRDATFTLNALLLAGYRDEAAAWRDWLVRAAAGCPQDLQVLYSVSGERRLDEYTVDWLAGYHGARPVRVGNAAFRQLQLDIYGEVCDTLHLARAAGLESMAPAWRIQRALLAFLEANWQQGDQGIWEMRGSPRCFTHSQIMAWVAFDRAVKDIEAYGLDGPLARWRQVRDAIHARVCEAGFDARRNCFVQYFGGTQLDASLLLIPQLGFLPPEDPRVRGTVDAICRELTVDGLVKRYSTASGVDALPPGEGFFLPCSFWLAAALALVGRRDDGQRLFEHLLGFANDVGLFSEEYDAKAGRMLGNFPQAMTHMALVNTARVLTMAEHEAAGLARRGERPASAGLHRADNP